MDERRIGGMDGWMEGRGRLPRGFIKRRQNEGNKKKGKKEDIAYPPFFLSKASMKAAEALRTVAAF